MRRPPAAVGALINCDVLWCVTHCCRYGVVTMPFGVREGINIFLAGFIPTENLRFREIGLT